MFGHQNHEQDSIRWYPVAGIAGSGSDASTDPLPSVRRVPRLPRRPSVWIAVILTPLAIIALVLASTGLLDSSLPWRDRPTNPPVPERSGTTLPGVFTYQQQRSLSCEYASVSIATSLVGRPVSEYEIEGVVPQSDNPHLGYRGDINGVWGNTDDYGVYNEPLASGLEALGFNTTVIYGGRDDLRAELDRGRPVIVWLALRGTVNSFDDYSADGSRFQLTQWMHVMVAYGYTESSVLLTDPGTAVLREYAWAEFMAMWDVMDGMALSIYA